MKRRGKQHLKKAPGAGHAGPLATVEQREQQRAKNRDQAVLLNLLHDLLAALLHDVGGEATLDLKNATDRTVRMDTLSDGTIRLHFEEPPA